MYKILSLIMLLLVACGEEPTPHFNDDSDSDTDTDTDTDSDTDSDEPTDTDCSDDGVCDNPPDNYCANIETLVIYYDTYNCIEDECIYDQVTEDCEWGCLIQDGDDKCGPDPCNGYVCDNPPDPYCLDNMSLQYYQDEGGCYLDDDYQPQCEYFPEGELEFCELGCIDEGDNTGHCEAGDTTSYLEDCWCVNDDVDEEYYIYCGGPDPAAICHLVGLECQEDSEGAWCA